MVTFVDVSVEAETTIVLLFFSANSNQSVLFALLPPNHAMLSSKKKSVRHCRQYFYNIEILWDYREVFLEFSF